MPLSKGELSDHIAEHFEFLMSSARAFDQGSRAEAKRLATSLRVLLHETPKSHSLLGQYLNIADLDFDNVPAEALADEDADGHKLLVATGGMISLVGTESGFSWVAKTTLSGRLTKFPQWWSEMVYRSPELDLTRRSVVLMLANKGGGAHVDPDVENAYRVLAHGSGLGWHDEQGPIIGGMNNPLPEIARATAAEVMFTLQERVART